MSVDLKLVLLGHKNVGKTSLFNRYVYDEFGKTSMVTIGAYFGMKQCKVNDRTCNLAIWDTAGEEKFDSLTNFYCRNARAALVCYGQPTITLHINFHLCDSWEKERDSRVLIDITSYETFQGLQRWVDKVTSEAEKNCACILVGNKLDIVDENPQLRQVETAEAKRYAQSIGALVIEASAKNGINVNEMFEQLVEKCFEQQADTIYKQEPRQTFPKPLAQPAKASTGCC